LKTQPALPELDLNAPQPSPVSIPPVNLVLLLTRLAQAGPSSRRRPVEELDPNPRLPPPKRQRRQPACREPAGRRRSPTRRSPARQQPARREPSEPLTPERSPPASSAPSNLSTPRGLRVNRIDLEDHSAVGVNNVGQDEGPPPIPRRTQLWPDPQHERVNNPSDTEQRRVTS